MVKIDKGLVRPELTLQLLARYHLTRALEQHTKNSKGLALQPKSAAFPDQLARGKVELEGSKLSFPSVDCFEIWRHGLPPAIFRQARDTNKDECKLREIQGDICS